MKPTSLPKEPSNVKPYPVVLAGPATVKEIWILALVFASAGVFLSASLYSFQVSAGFLAGSGVSLIVFRLSGEGIPAILQRQKNIWFWFFVLKYPVIAMLCYLLFRFNLVHITGFLAGLSVIYVSIMVKGFILILSYLSRRSARNVA